MKNFSVTRCDALTDLCETVRSLVNKRDYDTCFGHICQAMAEYPDAPQPHNLLGIILELTGNHVSAMKHFRASLDLDPTYAPPSRNLTKYGTFYSNGSIAFDVCDCQQQQRPRTGALQVDSYGIAHFVRRK